MKNFILITLILLFNIIYFNTKLFAENDNKGNINLTGDVINSFYSAGYASSPECVTDMWMIAEMGIELFGGIGLITTGKSKIAAGITLMGLPEPISKIKGTALITLGGTMFGLGMASLGKLAFGAGGYMACYLSFVRDPVAYYPENIPAGDPDQGKRGMKKIKTMNSEGLITEFSPTDKYWEAISAPSSDRLTVCARNLAPTGIFSFSSCYSEGKNIGGWITGTSTTFKSRPDYNSKNALLCPEEYRQLGRKPTSKDPKTGLQTLACKDFSMEKCPKDQLENHFHSSNDHLQNFKLTFGAPSCKTSKELLKRSDKDELNINGFTYKIKNTGKQICAYLTHGLGFIPMPIEWNIGCIKKTTLNIYPKCSNSKPIYENYTVDKISGQINPGGPPYKIIHYDNSDCINLYNQCGISALCKNAFISNSFSDVPLPITSYIMGCLKGTQENFITGCKSETNPSEKIPGMLSIIQYRTRYIIFLVLCIAVFIFGFKIIFLDSQPKIPEIMIFIIKIAAVIYFTNYNGSVNSEHNGIEVFSKFIQVISENLQNAVLNISSERGLCDFSNKNYIINNNDYSFLRIWDSLDCHVYFYLTNAKKVFTDGTSLRLTMIENIMSVMNFGINWLMIAIALLLFGIFLLLWVAQICEIIITVGILFSLLILLSPIFIPFILFPTTKKMFDQWINKIIAFSLYPVLIFAFLGFCLLVVDNIVFGETIFMENTVKIQGREIKMYTIDPSSITKNCDGFSVTSDGEAGTIPSGCDCNGVACMMNASIIKTKDSNTFLGETISADINVKDQKTILHMHKNIFSLLFIIFIFYHLTKKIYELLDVLSGSSLTLGEIESTSPHQRLEGGTSSILGMIRRKNKSENGSEQQQNKKTNNTKDDKNKTNRANISFD